MAQLYRLKRNVVQAVQWTGDNLTEVIKFFTCDCVDFAGDTLIVHLPSTCDLMIKPNHYVVTTSQGRYWVLDERLFQTIYEEIE